MRWGFKSCHFVNAVYAECLLWFFFERWSHSVPDGFLVFFEVFYMFLNGLFWMFLGMKMSTIFCFPTALTVYGVDFLILDLDGFKTGNHSGLFWKIPCQKVGCSTQILCNHQISCFKAMLDIFLVKKNDLLKWYFLAILYLRMNFFELHFPIFFDLLGLILWLLLVLTFSWDMSGHVSWTQHTFCWEGQKGCFNFLQKRSSIF